jgi:hypothetical protein
MTERDAKLTCLLSQRSFCSLSEFRYSADRCLCFGMSAQFFNVRLRVFATDLFSLLGHGHSWFSFKAKPKREWPLMPPISGLPGKMYS